jgi:uncharacterized protein YceH (UPF0502 family)
MSQRLPRQLDAHELRVLGCLLEKEQATPEYYPLTLNALVAACNQRSNRMPVMSLSDREVHAAAERLREAGLTSRDDHGRATRWQHTLDRRLRLDAASKAALTVLLLRGAQTAGEVRGRSGRLYEFGSVGAAESALADLADPDDPLVELLEVEPGQKEPRWAHRMGVEEPGSAPPGSTPPPRRAATPAAPQFDVEQVMMRLARLEQQVEELQSAVRRLRGATTSGS